MRLLDFNSFINESYMNEDQSFGDVSVSSEASLANMDLPVGKTHVAGKGGEAVIGYGVSDSDAMLLFFHKEGQPISLHKKGEDVDSVYDHKYTTPEEAAANAYSILMSFLQSIGKATDYVYIQNLLSALNSELNTNKQEAGDIFTAFVVGLKNHKASPTEAANDFTSLHVEPKPDYLKISDCAKKAFA